MVIRGNRPTRIIAFPNAEMEKRLREIESATTDPLTYTAFGLREAIASVASAATSLTVGVTNSNANSDTLPMVITQPSANFLDEAHQNLLAALQLAENTPSGHRQLAASAEYFNSTHGTASQFVRARLPVRTTEDIRLLAQIAAAATWFVDAAETIHQIYYINFVGTTYLHLISGFNSIYNTANPNLPVLRRAVTVRFEVVLALVNRIETINLKAMDPATLDLVRSLATRRSAVYAAGNLYSVPSGLSENHSLISQAAGITDVPSYNKFYAACLVYEVSALCKFVGAYAGVLSYLRTTRNTLRGLFTGSVAPNTILANNKSLAQAIYAKYFPIEIVDKNALFGATETVRSTLSQFKAVIEFLVERLPSYATTVMPEVWIISVSDATTTANATTANIATAIADEISEPIAAVLTDLVAAATALKDLPT